MWLIEHEDTPMIADVPAFVVPYCRPPRANGRNDRPSVIALDAVDGSIGRLSWCDIRSRKSAEGGL